MREEVILEVRPGWGPEAHIQSVHQPPVPALHALHPPQSAGVEAAPDLQLCLHIPGHLSQAIKCRGTQQVKFIKRILETLYVK